MDNWKQETGDGLSLDRVLDALVGLGLTLTEAQAYVFLAKKGPHKGKELADALRLTRQQLYPCLKNLQGKGLVNCTTKRHVVFSAVPLEKVLDMLAKARMEEAELLRQNREEYRSGLNP